MNRSATGAIRGALAGAVATIPMSAVMLSARRAGHGGEYGPKLITERLLDAFGLDPAEPLENLASTLAHFAFGTAAGSVFGAARTGVTLPLPTSVQGLIYGLFVYGASYYGWVPALEIMPEPGADRPDRQRRLVASHLVYGATLGVLVEVLERRRGV